ncbi:hypothetical protein ACFQE0_10240 [Methylobacterium komagatae]|jgi:hypothetical protein|uniref:Uncharacterized protein n=1 Tax=Methylobacterium komagatae TaxID=374425 RepID=A0ABW2BJ63_9HYPH|nr:MULTISPECIES: hypothetical protein [Methylobacterium]MBY0250432.1 hypothetical protein [Methylobacterium organophilum]MWV22635.1 hypothetical protein [Methylobacterium sp. 2A]
MAFKRHVVRSMAAMILAIIAYVAPSAVEAHDGHVHCGHNRRAAAMVDAKAPLAGLALATSLHVPGLTGRFPGAPRFFGTMPVRPTASLKAADSDEGCCPGACKRCRCGTAVCGTLGIPAAPTSLSAPLFKAVVMVPDDVAGHEGAGPEALRKPPRTVA